MSTETSAPVAAPGNLATCFKVQDFVAAAVILGVLAAGVTFALRHFVYEPREEKAAFIEISRSSDAELRAKSLDELVSLDTTVYEFSLHNPGMHFAGIDAAGRVNQAITAKRGSQP